MKELADSNENEIVQDDTQIDVHSESDEKDLLNSLDEDFNPDTVVEQKTQKDMLLEQGEMSATAVLGFGEQMLKKLGHKDFAFDEAEVENMVKASGPLFVKHGGQLPPWLVQHKEEAFAVFAAGSLALSSYSQIKALKKMDKEKEVKETKPEDEAKPVEQVA